MSYVGMSYVGIYRCLHDAIVRAGTDLDSEQVGKLEKGDVVDVTDSRQISTSGGKNVTRLRISTIGWVSLKSHLLQKLEEVAAHDDANRLEETTTNSASLSGRSPRQRPRGLQRRVGNKSRARGTLHNDQSTGEASGSAISNNGREGTPDISPDVALPPPTTTPKSPNVDAMQAQLLAANRKMAELTSELQSVRTQTIEQYSQQMASALDVLRESHA
eukprot:SAG31_NODE_13080_length_894_cov_1.096855_1_plen_216_part_10